MCMSFLNEVVSNTKFSYLIVILFNKLNYCNFRSISILRKDMWIRRILQNQITSRICIIYTIEYFLIYLLIYTYVYHIAN